MGSSRYVGAAAGFATALIAAVACTADDVGSPSAPAVITDAAAGSEDARDAAARDAGDAAVPIPCPYDNTGTNAIECIAVDSGAGGDCVAPSQICCLGKATNACTDSIVSCLPDTPLRCSGRSSCSGADDCCLTTAKTFSVFDSCPPIIDRGDITKTDCTQSCPGYRVCRNDGECQDLARRCRRVRVKSARGDIDVGVCL